MTAENTFGSSSWGVDQMWSILEFLARLLLLDSECLFYFSAGDEVEALKLFGRGKVWLVIFVHLYVL